MTNIIQFPAPKIANKVSSAEQRSTDLISGFLNSMGFDVSVQETDMFGTELLVNINGSEIMINILEVDKN